jgi:RNA polymerase sigma-70 factor (ECF subfamily)
MSVIGAAFLDGFGHHASARDDASRPQPAAQDAGAIPAQPGTKEAIRTALLLLEPHERVALILVYYRGRSAADAARMMGVAESTMRRYIDSALRTLRDVLS